MSKFGPSFLAELEAAGVAKISWVFDTGEIFGRDRLTAAENKKLDEVIAAHDPAKPAPPRGPVVYSKKRLFEAMTDAEYTKWEQAEGQQSKRKARMFREATQLATDDGNWGELYATMVAVFTKARTDALLEAARI